MSLKEKITARRQREIDFQINSILQATRELARSKGWSNVSIRKIALKIEYTPPVIYEHFKSREEILIELERQGFEMLKQRLNKAKTKEQEGPKQLVAMSLAYWDFALDHFDLYQIMFNLQGTQSGIFDNLSLRISAESVTEVLQEVAMIPTNYEAVFFQWYALVHGFCALHFSEQCPGMQTKLRDYLAESIKGLIKSLQ